MTTLEIIVFSFFTFVTAFIFALWIWKKKDYKSGQLYDTRVVITLYSLPRIAIIWFAILLIFFVLELSKLHLLYIFPMIYFITNAVQAKRVLKEDNKRK